MFTQWLAHAEYSLASPDVTAVRLLLASIRIELGMRRTREQPQPTHRRGQTARGTAPGGVGPGATVPWRGGRDFCIRSADPPRGTAEINTALQNSYPRYKNMP